MSCCTVSQNVSLNPQAHLDDSERKVRDCQISSFALALIALVVFAAGSVLLGIGTLPSSLMTGMGYFYVIGGAFVSMVAAGIFIGALASGGAAIYRSCKNSRD